MFKMNTVFQSPTVCVTAVSPDDRVLWPYFSGVRFDRFCVILGQERKERANRWFGDPRSARAPACDSRSYIREKRP